MANKTIEKIQNKAERLYNLRRVIEQKEEDNKKDLETLKLERDDLNDELIEDMKRVGIPSFKVMSGDSITIKKRKGVEIVNEAQAFDWAIKNKAVSVNKILLDQILKDIIDIPACFNLIETEFISVIKSK